MKKLLILFLLLSNTLFSQEIKVQGNSSIILNNKKDINRVENNVYKNKLINDAIKNAINQAISFTIQIDEKSEIDFDEANQNSIPKDRFNLRLTSGLVVEWRIEGIPYITKDLRTKNRWNCKVSGFVKELKDTPNNNLYSLKPEVEKKEIYPGDWVCSLGFGVSLPQTFTIPLQSDNLNILPKWNATIYSINYVGISFGLKKDLDLALGMSVSFANLELRTKDINNTEMYLKTTLYGGRLDIGTFKKTINPRFGIFILTGNLDKDICTITGVIAGIDFLKGRFKIGPEVQIYFVNSTYSQDEVEFKNNNLFMPNSDIKFNAGISFKLFL
jgi:hypothetical protein